VEAANDGERALVTALVILQLLKQNLTNTNAWVYLYRKLLTYNQIDLDDPLAIPKNSQELKHRTRILILGSSRFRVAVIDGVKLTMASLSLSTGIPPETEGCKDLRLLKPCTDHGGQHPKSLSEPLAIKFIRRLPPPCGTGDTQYSSALLQCCRELGKNMESSNEMANRFDYRFILNSVLYFAAQQSPHILNVMQCYHTITKAGGNFEEEVPNLDSRHMAIARCVAQAIRNHQDSRLVREHMLHKVDRLAKKCHAELVQLDMAANPPPGTSHPMPKDVTKAIQNIYKAWKESTDPTKKPPPPFLPRSPLESQQEHPNDCTGLKLAPHIYPSKKAFNVAFPPLMKTPLPVHNLDFELLRHSPDLISLLNTHHSLLDYPISVTLPSKKSPAHKDIGDCLFWLTIQLAQRGIYSPQSQEVVHSFIRRDGAPVEVFLDATHDVGPVSVSPLPSPLISPLFHTCPHPFILLFSFSHTAHFP